LFVTILAAIVYTFRVVHSYPHDPQAFTQGLEYRDGFLYEGTGLNGRSTLRKEELETGRVLKETDVPQQYFGEGITVLGDRIVQLTWQSQTGFIYDRESFALRKTFAYVGEGWGLTHDAKHVYMSDGSAQIRVLNPETLEEERRITVNDDGQPIERLNELEVVGDEIYANVWGSDRIVRFSPADGHVTGWIDLTGLLPRSDRTTETDVLNGIAYDARGHRLFVTGKLWPKLFEIRLVARKDGHGE